MLPERLALGPALRQHHHLGGVAVERAVVDHLGGDVLGQEAQLGRAVLPGDDHHWRYAPELTGDVLFEDRVVGGDAALALRARRSPDDEVVGAVRAGDVHVDDLRVVAQVRADLGAAVDEAQVAALDERLERPLVHRTQVFVYRVELDQAHLALVKHLEQGIGRRDRGDVARPEDQRHAALGLGTLAVEAGLLLARLLLGDPRQQAHPRGKTSEQRLIVAVAREHRDLGAAVPPRTERPGGQLRLAFLLDVVERADEQPHAARRHHRSAEPLFTGRRLVHAQPLGLARRGGPLGGDLLDARQAGAQQRCPFTRRQADEHRRLFAQDGDGFVELLL